MSESEDPFIKLIDVISALEQYNRALCLISVYLGGRTDSNTISGITYIYNKLLGDEVKPGKVRSLLTNLVNVELIGRETEKILGTSKVSFHQITPLGIIGLLYIIFFLIDNPSELEWDKSKFEEVLNGEESQFIDYLLNLFISKLPTPEKIINSVRSGKDITKIKVKPMIFKISRTLSGNGIAFKVFEEILWDYLHFNTGLTKIILTEKLDGESVGKYLKRLAVLISIEKIGKIEYYKLATKGIFFLPIIVLLIRELSVDKSVFESLMTTKMDSNENPWILLAHQANRFFKKLYNLELQF